MARTISNIRDFEEFYNEYYVPVIRYCASIIKDKEDAKDIVQQAFVILWQKRNEHNFHTSAKSYLYKTVHNLSLNILKHNEIKNRYEKGTQQKEKNILYQNKPEEAELMKMIEEALSRLPEQCGKIFRMSRINNLKYREIATALDISEKTVENQMGKALKLLRESLKEYLPLLLLLINLIK